MTAESSRTARPKRTGEQSADVAIVGLGPVGSNLARHALELDCKVAGFDAAGAPDDLVSMGLVALRDKPAIRRVVGKPRLVLLYLQPGPGVDEALDELAAILGPDDVVADGSNSYWRDSLRRAERMKKKGIDLIDIGTSGGTCGARHGACFMVGGERAAVARAEPLLARLAVPGGFAHAGGPGAGHYAKLVHDGVEAGMMQAIGEGIALLERYPGGLPVAGVLNCWRHGSVIRSWLIELMHEAYRAQGGLAAARTEDRREVNLLVDDALRMEVAVPVIAQSVIQRIASKDRSEAAANAVEMMRNALK